MKRITYLKSLLLAAGLCVGASAWADEINATLVHTASSSCGADANSYTSTVDVEKEHVNNSNFGNGRTWAGAAYADFSFAIPTGQTVLSATLSFTVYGSAKDRTADLSYVAAGTQLDYDALNEGTAKVNLASSNISTGLSFPKTSDKTHEIDVTDALRTIIAAEQTNIIFKLTNNAGGGDLYGKGSTKAPTLVITTADASSTVSYTVNYLLESDHSVVLKEATVHEDGIKGSTAAATAEEMASFKNDGATKKYIYVAEGSTPSIASLSATTSENQITLLFREAATWGYTVKTSTGVTLASGSDFEQESVTVSYNGFYLDGTDLYAVDKYNDSKKQYRATLTLDADNKEITINASKSKENVVFYTEGEGIDGMAKCGGSNVSIRCSGAAAGTSSSPVTITKLLPGKYQIIAGLYDNSSSSHYTATISVGETDVTYTTTGVNVTTPTPSVAEITVTQPTDVVFGGLSSTNNGLDYVYIQKTGDATEITATIGDAGWTTFASSYALGLSNMTASTGEVTAYYASAVGESSVTMTSTESAAVAAGEGLMLKGTAGATITIPVVASGTAIDGNLLKGCTVETVLDANANNYVLVNNGAAAEFQKLDENGATIPAGKAYLNAGAGARSLSVVFADEATAVKSISAAKENGEVYNLAGQRVAAPQKGLYIVNGRKVIVK